DGQLLESHDAYPEVIRVLARQRSVPLIDIYQKSTALVRELGDEKSRELFLHVEKGVYPAYPEGATDDTHTQKAGAETFAKMTAEALKALGLI
ncbi:MAG: rhamnogalacturonan acetylesterase, partial [Clostridia bacterium]|nr:rhamnogalacturonan acetylesterase [Clostridia bacterium]